MDLDPAALDRFEASVGGDGVVVRHGYLVRAFGAYWERGDWASAVKPVTSTLLLFAVAEGRLGSPDDLIAPQVTAHFGRDLAAKDAGIRWRHLGAMTSGYARAERAGEAWAYNDVAVMLYSVLLFDAVFGGAPDVVAVQRFAALQLEDGGLYGSRGGYGLDVSPRDFARIGWLWANRGHWAGVDLLPSALLDDALRPHVPLDLPRTTASSSDYLGVGSIGGDTDQGFPVQGVYGFNWWFNTPAPNGALNWPDVPADAFQANGHDGLEVCVVIPSLSLVVAARGNWGSLDPGNAAAPMNRTLKLLVDAVRTGPDVLAPAPPRRLRVD